jgi:hypothetical protein
VFITPDGARLMAGTLLQRLAPWKWNGLNSRRGHGGFPKQLIAWSNRSGSRLILLHPGITGTSWAY